MDTMSVQLYACTVCAEQGVCLLLCVSHQHGAYKQLHIPITQNIIDTLLTIHASLLLSTMVTQHLFSMHGTSLVALHA
jgi:hypothetical protein